MANVKFTNANKNSILLDWKNSTANRTNELYFITDQVNAKEIEELCFSNGILVTITQVDSLLSKIVFVSQLT